MGHILKTIYKLVSLCSPCKLRYNIVHCNKVFQEHLNCYYYYRSKFACNGSFRQCMLIDNGHISHCTLLSVGQSFRTHDRSSAWLHGCTHYPVHCQISVHVQTSDVVVMAPGNRKLALLLAVAASAAPTLFI